MQNTVNSFKTITEIEEYRKQINEELDARAEYIKLCESAYNLSEKSFGYIKESFENLSPDLFNSKAGKMLINKYTSTIKENKNLYALHNIYENVRKANADTDVDFFAKSLCEMQWGVDKNAKKDIKKLGMILAEAFLYLGNDAESKLDDDKEKLHEAIEFIASNKQTAKNISEYSNAIKLIKEDIKTHKNIVNESEMFYEKKEACVKNIKEAMETSEENTKERLQTVLEQISKKEYSEETFTNDMKKLSEIEKLF